MPPIGHAYFQAHLGAQFSGCLALGQGLQPGMLHLLLQVAAAGLLVGRPALRHIPLLRTTSTKALSGNPCFPITERGIVLLTVKMLWLRRLEQTIQAHACSLPIYKAPSISPHQRQPQCAPLGFNIFQIERTEVHDEWSPAQGPRIFLQGASFASLLL